MRIRNLVCSLVIAVLLCFTAFAVPNVDLSGKTPVIGTITQNSDAVAYVNINLEAVEVAAPASEVATSPPKNARRFQISNLQFSESFKAPFARWQPNTGYKPTPPSEQHQDVIAVARSGSY